MTPFGVYVHIPFCSRRCDYCAFATWTDRHHLHEAYVDACVEEIRRADLPPASSVFFGGGTPSLIPTELLLRVLRAIPLAGGAEVTVECNPETVTPALFDAYTAGGVTRVSFGVQSMVPSVLASLGREHDVAAVQRAVRLAASAGFASWNVDLIYGAAGETLDEWRRTVDAVLAFEPPHVSAYALTVEAGTPLARDATRHPDDDDQAAKYLAADGAFAAAGLRWYEVSNWALPGHECKHNSLYWSGDPYRGVGCAAHSFDGARRWWNVRTPDRYIAAIGAGRSPVAGEERLDGDARRLESLALALRTRRGVPAEALSSSDRDAVADLVDVRDDRLVLTPEGRLLANEVAVRLR
ncbi:MAG TPA: radical SAM family heme chaperone HemW [Acidimicrobiales bacterium]